MNYFIGFEFMQAQMIQTKELKDQQVLVSGNLRADKKDNPKNPKLVVSAQF